MGRRRRSRRSPATFLHFDLTLPSAVTSWQTGSPACVQFFISDAARGGDAAPPSMAKNSNKKDSCNLLWFGWFLQKEKKKEKNCPPDHQSNANENDDYHDGHDADAADDDDDESRSQPVTRITWRRALVPSEGALDKRAGQLVSPRMAGQLRAIVLPLACLHLQHWRPAQGSRDNLRGT